MKEEILKKIENRDIQIAIVGLGYVGLPLAVEFAKAGVKVKGYDIDDKKTEKINKGVSYVKDVSSEDLAPLIQEGLLTATTDSSVLNQVDGIIIAVPTPLSKTKDPDLSYVIRAAHDVKRNLKRGHIISFESTTYPGTTDEIILPLLEETGLRVGKDFYLAFSPERIDPGNKKYTVKNTPKLVGGVEPDSTEVVSALYSLALLKVVPVSSSRVAEAAKLLENTFRSINIGLANEMAIMCNILGIDVWEVIEAAATKPFGFMKFYPGPGIGGHCIPIDPIYLSWKLKTFNYTARFIETATDINSNMPRYVVSRIQDALNEKEQSLKGSRILVLGIAYKRDIDDVRESPILDIIDLLEQKGAHVEYYDPHVPWVEISGKLMESVKKPKYRDYHIVVLGTDHSAFDYNKIYLEAPYIFDTRNAFKNNGVEDKEQKIVTL